MRYWSAAALGAIHADAEAVIPALCDALGQGDFERTQVLIAIGKFGSRAKPAVPALILRLHDDPTGIVFQTLGLIGEEAAAAVPSLIAILEDPASTRDQQAGVAWALARMGAGARPAVQALEAAAERGVENAADAVHKLRAGQ